MLRARCAHGGICPCCHSEVALRWHAKCWCVGGLMRLRTCETRPRLPLRFDRCAHWTRTLGWLCGVSNLTLVYVVLWQLTHLTVNHTCVTPEKSLFTGRKLMKQRQGQYKRKVLLQYNLVRMYNTFQHNTIFLCTGMQKPFLVFCFALFSSRPVINLKRLKYANISRDVIRE